MSHRTGILLGIVLAMFSAKAGRCAESATSSPTAPTFERLQLSPEFVCEGANIADFDHDGAPDVVSGPDWYVGPGFTERVAFRTAAPLEINDYSDQFFTFTHDVDGDSWADIIIIGLPGTEAFWFQNPQGKPGKWQRHLAVPMVDNESPAFVDITGDGRPELVFHVEGRLGFAEIDPQNATQPWKFHAISDARDFEKYTHGLGVGDVNGDGRQDILEKTGWWEQPASLAAAAVWQYHPVSFSQNGGAQMYAYDFDDDGDNDVVTSKNAHGYGLAWFENVDGKGDSFKEHLILEETNKPNRDGVAFSQLHALTLADIDGDGVQDVVTGKRFWAHNGRDPGERDPAVLYWFRTTRNADGVEFAPHLIDSNSGVGTQVVVGDVNRDRLPDVVVGNKKGTFLLLQKAPSKYEPPQSEAQP